MKTRQRFITMMLALVAMIMGTQVLAQSKQAYAVLSNDGKTLTFYCDGKEKTWENSGAKVCYVGGYQELPEWYKEYEYPEVNPNIIEKVVFEKSFQDARPVSTSNWFFDQEKLTTIKGFENLNTSEVTTMSRMFCNCTSLTSLDLSSFDTSNVYNMFEMFSYCTSLKNLNLSNFDTSNVTDMNSMFDNCTSLTSLDISSFDTSNVTDMNAMFHFCKKLNNLDLSSFKTEKVTEMAYMFSSCESLTGLDLRNFNTTNVMRMDGMFQFCKSLYELNLNSFDTHNVEYMDYMFCNCVSIKTIDLTSFDTRNVTIMSGMFQSCKELSKIYVGEKWSTASLIETEIYGQDNGWFNMFSGCSTLVGGEGTVYDPEHIGKEYAHIDGIDGPGYLTAAPSLGIATSLNQVTSHKSQVASDEWYTIDGRKLNGMPAKKGIYIHNGKKGVAH